MHEQLDVIGYNISHAKAKLLKEYAIDQQSTKKEAPLIGFIDRLKSTIVYDTKKSLLSIKGDFQYIRRLIKSGGSNLLKGTIHFTTHALLTLLLVPFLILMYIFIILWALIFPSFKRHAPLDS